MELAVQLKVRVSHLALHVSERGKQLLLLVQPKQRKLISMNYGQMAPSLSDPDQQYMNYGQMALSLSDPDQQYMNYGQIAPSLSDPDPQYELWQDSAESFVSGSTSPSDPDP